MLGQHGKRSNAAGYMSYRRHLCLDPSFLDLQSEQMGNTLNL